MENKLDSFSPVADVSVKKEIINFARDEWEVYFSRLFPATVRGFSPPPLPTKRKQNIALPIPNWLHLIPVLEVPTHDQLLTVLILMCRALHFLTSTW